KPRTARTPSSRSRATKPVAPDAVLWPANLRPSPRARRRIRPKPHPESSPGSASPRSDPPSAIRSRSSEADHARRPRELCARQPFAQLGKESRARLRERFDDINIPSRFGTGQQRSVVDDPGIERRVSRDDLRQLERGRRELDVKAVTDALEYAAVARINHDDRADAVVQGLIGHVAQLSLAGHRS